jgi:hypothetical protein
LKLQYSTRKRPHANGGFCQPEIENLPWHYKVLSVLVTWR